MNIFAELKKSPGFIYQIGTQYYFLGKYICKPCTDTDITDTHYMYDLASAANETANAAFYFQKLRAYSDFALEVPFNKARLDMDFAQLEHSLSAFQIQKLEEQYQRFLTFL